MKDIKYLWEDYSNAHRDYAYASKQLHVIECSWWQDGIDAPMPYEKAELAKCKAKLLEARIALREALGFND